MNNLLWPPYATPEDIRRVESVPLQLRGLPPTTYALLRRAAARWPDRIAISVLPTAKQWDRPIERSYAQLLGDVHRVANVLRALGIGRHDAVAMLAPNCNELITVTLASQLAGIAAPINGSLSPEHVHALVESMAVKVLVTAGPELDQTSWVTAQGIAAAGKVEALLVLQPTAASGTPSELPTYRSVKVGYLSELAAGQRDDEFAGDEPQPDDFAALFHTGGTTGTPRLAAHTHANEITDAWMIAAYELLDETSVCFAALPLFHVNALVVTLLAPMYKGQRVVWAGPLGYREANLFREFWRIVEHHKIATMSGVPTVYAALAQCPVDADISSLRFAMVGAAPLPAAVRADFETRAGVPMVEGYGLTEATCASARSFPDYPRPGSVGQRLPYQQVKAIKIGDDGEWTDLPPGEIGALALTGPTTFPGYVIGRERGKYTLDGLGKLRGGWLETGDLAYVDEEGFVHLAGRAKDLIIRGGHNIDPAVIEEALLEHPAVTGAAAVGRPDVHAGEVPIAYVTVAAAVSADELSQWATQRVLEAAAVPKAVHIVDALPVTEVGKPYKLALRADATRRAIASALATSLPDVAVEAVIEDGAILAIVTASPATDQTALKAAMDVYPIKWQMEVRS